MRLFLQQYMDAPPDVVFAMATDVPSWPEHVSGIEKTEVLTDGPIGVDTKFHETRILMKKEATEEMWFTQFEPPHHFTLESNSCGSAFRTTQRFIPQGEGTLVEMEMVTRPVTIMAWIMIPVGWLMKPMMRKLIAKDFADLAAAAAAKD